MRNERAWPQQCWKSCANGPNIVAPRFGDHGTKKMLGVVGWIVWPVSNFAQQHSTTCNRVCKRTQHVTSNNVASFARGLKPKVGVVGSVAGWLLCCGVGTVHCLFNLLYDVIWWLHPSATPSNYLKSLNRAFSHDIMAAILVFQNNETAAMLVYQDNPVGVELFSYANAFFCSNKFA